MRALGPKSTIINLQRRRVTSENFCRTPERRALKQLSFRGNGFPGQPGGRFVWTQAPWGSRRPQQLSTRGQHLLRKPERCLGEKTPTSPFAPSVAVYSSENDGYLPGTWTPVHSHTGCIPVSLLPSGGTSQRPPLLPSVWPTVAKPLQLSGTAPVSRCSCTWSNPVPRNLRVPSSHPGARQIADAGPHFPKARVRGAELQSACLHFQPAPRWC